jgi:hypothetical protein
LLEPTYRRKVSTPFSGWNESEIRTDPFKSEDRGDKFLRNIGSNKTYTTPNSRRPHCSCS